MLKLERQLLKRRVKRDFLEPPSLGQQQQLNQAQGQPNEPSGQLAHNRMQLLRPAARPGLGQQQRPFASLVRPPTAASDGRRLPPPPQEPLEPAGSGPAGALLAGPRRPQPLGAAASSPRAQFANSTAASAAPFNDPSWPLMWYLVSASLHLRTAEIRSAGATSARALWIA